MMSATILDNVLFDLSSLLVNGLSSSELGIRRCDVVQSLMQAFVVVIFDEDRDLLLKFSRMTITIEKNMILQ